MTSQPATQWTARSLWTAIVHWVRANLVRTLIMSVIGFAIGWFLNVYIIAVKYEGFGASGRIGTAGSAGWVLRNGGLYWGILSTMVFSLFSYGHRVGWKRLFSEMLSIPKVLAGTFSGSDPVTLGILLWGAAVSLLAGVLIGPAVAGILGLGLLLAAPSPIAGVLGRALTRLWMGVLHVVSPAHGRQTPGLGGTIAGVFGTALGMVVAWQVTSTAGKAILAVAAGGAAYLIMTKKASPPAVARMLLFLGLLLMLRRYLDGVAFADDGGWTECAYTTGGCNPVAWLGSEGAGRVMGEAARGGVAAGVGAGLGTALGGVVGEEPGGETPENESSDDGGDDSDDSWEPKEIEEDEEFEADLEASKRRDIDEFLKKHPEYEAIRGALIRPDGKVDDMVVADMMDHYEKFGPNSDWAKQQAAEQTFLRKYADDFFMDHPDYSKIEERVYRPDGTIDKALLRQAVAHYNKFKRPGPAETPPSWIADGLAMTGREIFTGVDADGNTSYSSMVLRGLLGVATGGQSEWVYVPGDAGYRLKDGVDRGESGATLIGKVAGGVVFDEVAGRVMGAGIQKGLGKLAQKFPGLTKKVGELTDDISGKLNKPILGGAGGRKAASELSEGLAHTRSQTTRALSAAGDEADDAALRALYKDKGMKKLAELEAGGHLSHDEAQRLAGWHDQVTSKAATDGTLETIDEFAKTHGVKPTEVLVGNSGSTGPGRSVLTDADRTIVTTFDDTAVQAHLDANPHLSSPAEAHADLQRQFTDMHAKNVELNLNSPDDVVVRHARQTGMSLSDAAADLESKGMNPATGADTRLTAADMDTSSYSGFGSGAGPEDSYPRGYTRARQDIQGSTEVFTPKPDGTVTNYTTSGDAIIEQDALNAMSHTGEMPTDPTRIGFNELDPLLDQQRTAVAKYSDPKSIAKAVDRADYVAGRTGQPLPDPNLTAAASEIRANPQDTARILENHGLTQDEFVGGCKDMMDSYHPDLTPLPDDWQPG